MDHKDMGKRLREARKKKGLNQWQLAEMVNSNASYISDIERGIKTPSLNTFVDIIVTLEVSADYVLQGSVDSGKEYVCDQFTCRLEKMTPRQRQVALELVECYARSLKCADGET